MLWANSGDKFNIAIRLGKGNLVELESDNLSAESVIKKRLKNLGIHSESTCCSKRGFHHFLRIVDSPIDIGVTHWKPDVGKGEARIRNCYSLLPNSEVGSFQYHWNNDWYNGFKNLPEISWSDISDSAFS